MKKFSFYEYINPAIIAWRSLLAHKFRTSLTILGIVIGITTIIIILSIGQGLSNLILTQLGMWGSDTVFVEVRVPEASDVAGGIYQTSGYNIDTLKISEVEELANKKYFPDIDSVYGAQLGETFATFGGEELKVMIWSGGAAMYEVEDLDIAQGRFYTEEEENSLSKVIVIGPKVAEIFFKDEDPIGKMITFEKKKNGELWV